MLNTEILIELKQAQGPQYRREMKERKLTDRRDQITQNKKEQVFIHKGQVHKIRELRAKANTLVNSPGSLGTDSTPLPRPGRHRPRSATPQGNTLASELGDPVKSDKNPFSVLPLGSSCAPRDNPLPVYKILQHPPLYRLESRSGTGDS